MKDLVPDNAFEKLLAEGYLLLKTPANVEETVQMTFDLARSFFESSIDEKLISKLPSDMGYRQFAGEYSSSPDHPDQVESFSASVRMSKLCTRLDFPKAQALYLQMLRAIEHFEQVAELVTVQLAQKINRSLTQKQFKGAFNLWSFMQLNYSRPCEVSEELINDLHEDGCLLTVACTTTSGLQVRNAKGEFLDITTGTQEVIILPGEIFWLLSGGLIPPLYHRVRRDPNCSTRMSLLFFGDIAPTLCKPWIENELNRDTDIAERILKNPTRFGLTEWDWD